MINYLKKVEGVSTPLATRFEPLYKVGERKRAFAGENPDVYVDGVWHNSTNGVELMSGGNFDTQADVDLWTAYVATISLENGTMKITDNGGWAKAYRLFTGLTIGKKHRFVINSSIPSGSITIGATSVLNQTQFDGTYTTFTIGGELYIEFIADNSSMYIRLDVSGASPFNFDNGTLFETEIEPDTPYVIPQTYLPIKADINAEGEITNLIAWDAPSLVEDYIVADKVKAELLGKNAITCSVTFNGVNLPIIVDDENYNTYKVIKVATGTYRIYFKKRMKSTNYKVSFITHKTTTSHIARLSNVSNPKTLDYVEIQTLVGDQSSLIDVDSLDLTITGGM